MVTLKNKVDPKADKTYVDQEISKIGATTQFVKKTGDQMSGDLILPRNRYPIHGNTNKAINYESQREIFVSRYESFPMHTAVNPNLSLVLA